MKHRLWVGFLSLVVVTGMARADGINLSWDDCGALGSSFKTFACNTNTGEDRLVASIEVPAGVDSICYISSRLRLRAGGLLPDWWKLRSSLQPGDDPPFRFVCRDTLGMRLEYAPTGCPGIGAFPILRWLADGVSEKSSYLEIRFEYGPPVPTKFPVEPGIEHYLMTYVVGHAYTVGPDACAGCGQTACIVLNQVDLFLGESCQPVAVTTPLQRNHVTWQSDSILDCPLSTPVRRSTWGQVRSLYR